MTGRSNTTEEVFNHHVKALVSGDIEDLMMDYAPNAVLFTPNGTFKGLENIRAQFSLLTGVASPDAKNSLKVIRQDIVGEYAYILWSMPPLFPYFGDTFHIHNGKILMQSGVGQLACK